MENFKEIYVVISYGGEYEDSWESVECAFNTKSRATNWINKRKYLANTIGKDKFKEIENFIRQKEDEIYNRYYNEETDELLEGKNNDDYLAECNKFHDNVKFVLIENEFGIDKKTYEILEQIFDTSFTDYYIIKTKLYT